MIFSIIQLIFVCLFGFITVMATEVCDDDHEDCLFSCLDADGEHHQDACINTNMGNDCCAFQNEFMGQEDEPKTCESGYTVGKSDHPLVQICDKIGLMALTTICRFTLVLTTSILTCFGLCCSKSTQVVYQPGVVQQGQPVMVMVAHPVLAQPTNMPPPKLAP